MKRLLAPVTRVLVVKEVSNIAGYLLVIYVDIDHHLQAGRVGTDLEIAIFGDSDKLDGHSIADWRGALETRSITGCLVLSSGDTMSKKAMVCIAGGGISVQVTPAWGILSMHKDQ